MLFVTTLSSFCGNRKQGVAWFHDPNLGDAGPIQVIKERKGSSNVDSNSIMYHPTGGEFSTNIGWFERQ
ncbi:MAG: hypothetical protein WAM14_12900 [Candidatus Nitrosopolaris sp.]